MSRAYSESLFLQIMIDGLRSISQSGSFISGAAYGRYPEVLCVHLIEAHVSLKSRNIFGQVTGGCIRVYGSLAIATSVKGAHEGKHGLTVLLPERCGEITVGKVLIAPRTLSFSTSACDHTSKWHLLAIGKCEEPHNGSRLSYVDGLI